MIYLKVLSPLLEMAMAGSGHSSSAKEKQPPDKSFKKALSSGIPDELREENVKVESFKPDLENGFFRHYRVQQLPPMGASIALTKKFKSMDMFQLNTCRYKKRYMPSFSMHFTDKADYEAAVKSNEQ